MTETLKFLLSEFKPDDEFFVNGKAQEYASFMSKEDWDIITSDFDEYEDNLKYALVTIAGYASLDKTHDFLILRLYEWDTGLIMGCLFSIHRCYKNELEAAKIQMRIPFQFHPNEVSKIISSCIKFACLSVRDPEFEELISMLES